MTSFRSKIFIPLAAAAALFLLAAVFISEAACPTTQTASYGTGGEVHATWTQPTGCNGPHYVYLTVYHSGYYTVWIEDPDSGAGVYALERYSFTATEGCNAATQSVTLIPGHHYTMVVTSPLSYTTMDASAKIFLDCGQGR